MADQRQYHSSIHVNSTIYFESLDQYRINKGILIEAKEGDEVKAVRKAKVREIKKISRIWTNGIDGSWK